jgi:NtrC-family two-component system sensor histidine kinase KinB
MGDLIEVAELDTGKREFKLERLRPLQALNEARDRYCDEAARKRIRVEVRAYADLSVVKADRRALRSILDNLLANAIRYTPEEGEILLAAEEVKDFVQFTVRDTGRGIEAERLSTIFDRFNLAQRAGRGWAWRWCGGWWSNWADRLPWRAGWATERHSGSALPVPAAERNPSSG